MLVENRWPYHGGNRGSSIWIFFPIFLRGWKWRWSRKGDSFLLDFLPLSLSLALSIIVYPCDKKKLRSHGQPSVASRRFFIGKRRKDAKRSNLLGHFRSRPLGHADTLSILTFFSKMDGESRKGKMIEDPLEEDPCCSVFFSAKICSLNGINDKMAFHSIDSLFNKFFEFLYVIALLCISSVCIVLSWFYMEIILTKVCIDCLYRNYRNRYTIMN